MTWEWSVKFKVRHGNTRMVVGEIVVAQTNLTST